jgi:HSP20 family protein
MALVPFGDFDRFFEDDDWFLPITRRPGMADPSMDLYETEKDVVAEMSLPDINPENVEITIEESMLRIAGTMEDKQEEKKKGYYRKEIRKGSFERITHLPAPVQEDAIQATYEKGILKIVMPKQKQTESTPKKIKVTEKK